MMDKSYYSERAGKKLKKAAERIKELEQFIEGLQDGYEKMTLNFVNAKKDLDMLRGRNRYLEAQLAAAWTLLIDDKGRAVEGALPPAYEGITASVYFPKLDKSIVHFVYYKAANRTFCYHGNGAPIKDGIVYAYIVKPAPAPYPVREEE